MPTDEPAAPDATPAVLSFTTRRVMARTRVRQERAKFRANAAYRREHRLQTRALELFEKSLKAHDDGVRYGAASDRQAALISRARDAQSALVDSQATIRDTSDAEVRRLSAAYAELRLTRAAAVTTASADVAHHRAALKGALGAEREAVRAHGDAVVEERTALAASAGTRADDLGRARRTYRETLRGLARQSRGIA